MDEPVAEEEELEFEPLFDYRRVQPINFISLDDDFSDSEEPVPISPKKRLKKFKQTSNRCDVVDTVVCDVDKDEEDWLPPPPKTINGERKIEQEDSTIKALRLKKQELASFAQSAEDVLRQAEEATGKRLTHSTESLESEDAVKVSKPLDDRKKIVISIQGKEGLNKYRVYMDEMFDRIFKAYAEKVKRDLESLVFSFDGDKVSVTATPDSLGMEEDDIIEVNTKSR